jgi:hypothetical protein
VGGNQGYAVDVKGIRARCQSALYDPLPSADQDVQTLIEELEGYISLLVPEVAECAPRMQVWAQDMAQHVMGRAREVMEAPADRPAARVWDRATYARALVTLYEQATPPPDGSGGWLLVVS